MKFTVNQKVLNAQLNLVKSAVPSHPIHPVLANILINVNQDTNQITLFGCDLSLGIKTLFDCEVFESGEFTLPAKIFSDIISKLSDEDITISQTPEEYEIDTVNILTGSGKFRVRGLKAEQYPNFLKTEIDLNECLTLPVEVFLEGLSNTLFAASTEDTKQILTGIHIESGSENIEFASTDSHRLAVFTSYLENMTELNLTIPSRSLREVEKVLKSGTNDTFSLSQIDNQTVFYCGNQTIISRRLEGNYPSYNQLLPKSFANTITVSRKDLVSKVSLVSVLADQKSHLVRFIVTDGELTLLVEAAELGTAKETIKGDLTGKGDTIAFNSKYLIEGLRAIKSEEITMQFNKPDQPVVFIPAIGPKTQYLVMPVAIRS